MKNLFRDSHDGFIFYNAIVGTMLLLLAIAICVYTTSSLMWITVPILVSVWVIGYVIHVATTRPLKVYSPFPIKLDRWMFVFYVVEGSRMVDPQDLFMETLTKRLTDDS